MDLKVVLGNFIVLLFLVVAIKSQNSSDTNNDWSNPTKSSGSEINGSTTTKSTSTSETFVIETVTSSSSTGNLTTENITEGVSTTMSYINITEITTTSPDIVTMETATNKPENCMVSRKDGFIHCIERLGDNAMTFIEAKNESGFLDDMCDANGSKPYMECLQRHFRDCPAFLTRPEVTVLQFGPYHIKDVTYFSSIDQMCSCVTGLACIQELIKIKRVTTFYADSKTSPWRMPKLRLLCDKSVSRNIGCVRQNLRQCQSPLTKRYGDDFTNEDADDIKRFYSFNKEHCSEVTKPDFQEKYRCIQEHSNSDEFRECVTEANHLQEKGKLCHIRDCVEEYIEDECDEEANHLIPLYIDAVNVYAHESYRLLNNVCSSAVNISISIVTIVVSAILVLTF